VKKNVFSGLLVLVLLVGVVGLLGATPQEETGEWSPQRTITTIVPWGAGGVSDQSARVLASEMETVLGVKIAIVNQRFYRHESRV